MHEQDDLEQRLAVALQERKLALAQQKNVEKLLEEVISEKDDLLGERAGMKKQLCKVSGYPIIRVCGWLIIKHQTK